jgi:hypothetical protein
MSEFSILESGLACFFFGAAFGFELAFGAAFNFAAPAPVDLTVGFFVTGFFYDGC